MIAAASALAVLLAGCGNSRAPVPNVTVPLAPQFFRALSFPSAGLTFQAPGDWSVSSRQAPLVTVVSSGTAVVAVWRFPRSQPLPGNSAALKSALQALVRAARSRNPTLELIRARALRLHGMRAIELDTIQRIGGQVRRVRSTHVFAYGSEVVLEEYAPPSIFHAVDHAVFSPVKRSLQIAPA